MIAANGCACSGTYGADFSKTAIADMRLSPDKCPLKVSKLAAGVSNHSSGSYDPGSECAGTCVLCCIKVSEAVSRMFIGLPLCL